MRILAIETTGPFCSAAILDGENIFEVENDEKMNHLKNLTPMIKELTDECGLQLGDMDAIAVSVGPGSFTGIRIGVTTARALSQMSGVKVIAVPTLYSFGCQEQREADRIVCPVFDARRSQVYAGAYGCYQEIVPGAPYMLDEFLEMLEDITMTTEEGETKATKFLFVGDGLKPYEERIRAWGEAKGMDVETDEVYQMAGGVAEFAADNFSEECLLDYGQVQPNYMRMAEAERNRLEQEAKKGEN